MNDRTIRAIAIALSLMVYAGARALSGAVQAPPAWLSFLSNNASLTDVQRFASAAVAAVSLGLIIFLFEYVLYAYFARRFTGKWVYRSSTGGYGIVEIERHGFWAGSVYMTYSVTLMRTAAAALDLLDGKTAEPYGWASGTMIALKDEKLHVVYQVSIGTSPKEKSLAATKGILTISPMPHKNFLVGHWESTKKNYDKHHEDDYRAGDLKFFRARQFRQQNATSSA